MVDVNRSTTNRGNASHQLINFSWRNIILFLYSIWKKYICIYKAKQKLAHQFISIWWYYFWYTTCRQFISILSINITKNCIYPITLNNEYKKKQKKNTNTTNASWSSNWFSSPYTILSSLVAIPDWLLSTNKSAKNAPSPISLVRK